MPQMTNVTGISEPAVDPSNNLLESEEFVPYWEKLNLTVSPSSRRLSPLVYDSENKKQYYLVVKMLIMILGFLTRIL